MAVAIKTATSGISYDVISDSLTTCVESAAKLFLEKYEEIKNKNFIQYLENHYTSKSGCAKKIKSKCREINDYEETLSTEFGILQDIKNGLYEHSDRFKSIAKYYHKEKENIEALKKSSEIALLNVATSCISSSTKVNSIHTGKLRIEIGEGKEHVCEGLKDEYTKFSMVDLAKALVDIPMKALGGKCLGGTGVSLIDGGFSLAETGIKAFIKTIFSSFALPIIVIYYIIKIAFSNYYLIKEILELISSGEKPEGKTADQIIFTNLGMIFGNELYDLFASRRRKRKLF